MDDSLSIILPAFNEEENIKEVICSIFDKIPSYISNFEVVVINDGSIDSTASKVNGLRASHINLKIIEHEKNMGYGYAIRSGIQSSTKRWLFIMDTDGQLHINDFEALWGKRRNYDFILGFRKKRADYFYRFLLGKLGSLTTSIMLRKTIIDINCGFKLFKREVLDSLSLDSTGNAIYFEILYKLFKNNNNRFLQYPVNHYPREHGIETGGSPKTIIKLLYEGSRCLLKNRI